VESHFSSAPITSGNPRNGLRSCYSTTFLVESSLQLDYLRTTVYTVKDSEDKAMTNSSRKTLIAFNNGNQIGRCISIQTCINNQAESVHRLELHSWEGLTITCKAISESAYQTTCLGDGICKQKFIANNTTETCYTAQLTSRTIARRY
jgi:hypothetical protein